MASELCMNCFSVKGQYEVCPYCGYVEGTPPEQPHYLTPGTILGNHFIVGTAVGFGGFGITYKCFDTTLGVTVAVKEFYPMGLVNRSPGESRVGLLSGDKQEQYKQQLNRFLLEAQSVAQFGKAKDIVNVYDFFQENGTAYIVMEYVDGVLLKDYLEKQGAMDADAAMTIIMLIIDAVKKIHSKGIIHRDISPDNIFIANESAIKIFDFGAAQLNNSKEGLAGEKVIKVGYSAPEQYRDASKQGFFTDIYSVGAILYQMLTGCKPIESTEREYKDELKSPAECGIKVNANTDRAVMEAIAVRPELRFQGIQQFEDALNNKRAAEYPKVKIKKRKRRRNWILATAALLVLAVGISIGLYSTILKPENRIFDAVVADNTAIEVWVENKEQKAWLESLKDGGFIMAAGENTDSTESTDAVQKVSAMQKDNQKVTYMVEVHENMEADLKATEELPDMFISDHVSNLSAYDPVSLRDNVYEAIDISLYEYMSEYEKYFPEMQEMPTGLDTLLLYHASVEYNQDNGLIVDNDTVLSGITYAQEKIDTETGTVAIEDLLPAVTEEYKVEDKLHPGYAVVADTAIPYAMVLQNTGWEKVFEKKENPEPAMRSEAMHILKFNQAAKAEKYILNYGVADRSYGDIYGNNIVSDVTFRSRMNILAKEQQDKGANPVSDYTDTAVVTCDDKMLVAFSERFAITGTSTEDEQTACMRLLWVMLTQNGQDKKAASTGAMSYPILKTCLADFEKYNRKFSHFPALVQEKSPCVLVGNLSGAMNVFADGLMESMAEEVSDSVLQGYCEEFITETEEGIEILQNGE
ncbi:MAG: serine/threonine protein kinase [Lachnospiraceae bacterium]|nr:serine/threonine protein kinase [Lachnospiraceae bacterium]